MLQQRRERKRNDDDDRNDENNEQKRIFNRAQKVLVMKQLGIIVQPDELADTDAGVVKA
jgi:hypothetical protein